MKKDIFRLLTVIMLSFLIGVLVGGKLNGDSLKYKIKNHLYESRIANNYFLSQEKNSTYKTAVNSVPCPTGNYLGVVTFGQSHMANFIPRKKLIKQIDRKTYMYDWTDRKCYPYSEPLVGTNGNDAGNLFSDVLFELRREGFQKDIIVAPLANSGSSVFLWWAGLKRKRLDFFLETTSKNQLKFDVWLWHQGAADAVPIEYVRNKNIAYGQKKGEIEEFYSSALTSIFNLVKQYNSEAKFGVSIASICHNNGSESIQKAQKMVINNNKEVFFSTNTDTLDNTYRWNGCHFNEEGARKIAKDYASLLLRIANE